MAKEKKSFFGKIIKNSPVADNEDENEAIASPASKIETKKEPKKTVEEGQLSVDVYETASAIVVMSIIGGVSEEDISISVENNVITIGGVREKIDDPETRNYFVAECFWGPFSRSIILPVEVDVERIKATMKNGILKVTLPKLSGLKSKKIKIEKE